MGSGGLLGEGWRKIRRINKLRIDRRGSKQGSGLMLRGL